MKKTEPEQTLTSEIPAQKGLPEPDLTYMRNALLRPIAQQECQRILKEFRQTGRVEEKVWNDYGHPDGDTQYARFQGYCAAADAIERRQEEAEGLFRPESEEPDWDEDENGEGAAVEQSGLAFAEAVRDATGRLEALKDLAAPVPAPVPEQPKAVGLLRGISFDPDLPGRNVRFEPAIPLLDVAPVPERLPALDDQTETLLNAMIGECHFLMRAVAFPSLCHARIAEDRLSWIERAMDLAKTGATVAKAVARLRHGPSIRESHQKITVENKVAVVQGGGGCANP